MDKDTEQSWGRMGCKSCKACPGQREQVRLGLGQLVEKGFLLVTNGQAYAKAQN